MTAPTRLRGLWVPAAVAVVAAVEAWSLDPTDLRGPVWLALCVQVAIAGLLVLRRSHPFLMTCVMAAVTVAWWLVEGDPPIASAITVSFVVASFSLGRHEPDRRLAWAGLGVVAGGLMLHLALDSRIGSWEDVAAELPWDLLIIGTWAVGALLRYRELYAEGVRRAAVEEERTRLARELHDVVAHGLSVMVVQAEAAAALLEDGDVRRTARALEAVQAVGRRSMTDLRASVVALRRPDDHGPRAPLPDLSALDELVASVRHAGLAVRLRREGTVGDVPASVQLATYRVVQESLTNTLRHTTATSVDILVSAALDRLTVRIDDPGPPRQRSSPTGGAGLAGMRERVSAVGGSLSTARNGDGYRVEASFPLEAT